jgi:phenylalanine-4-hydroxylase
VLGGLDELLELAHIDFLPLYQRVEGLPEFEPGQVLDSDRVLRRGTGRYAELRRQGQ